MSKTPPRPQPRLRSQLHFAAVRKLSKDAGGVTETMLIFSVDDTSWLAWYLFYQTSSAITDAWDRDTTGLKPANLFGAGTTRLPFALRKPLAVGDFGENNSVELQKRPLARLQVQRASPTALELGMTVFLKSGPANLHWFASTSANVGLPEEFQWGRVSGPMAVEDFSAGLVRGAGRFLP
jgi:hypothetical protein